MRHCLAVLLTASLLAGDAGSAAAQGPELTSRFIAIPAPPDGAVTSAFDPGDPREGFALVLGLVAGAVAGAWVGCQVADCRGDGPPPGALYGAVLGMPIGAGLMVWAVRTRVL